MGGAQLASMIFFAPTSLAIWIISLEVVPRTMESNEVIQAPAVKTKIDPYHQR